MHAHSLRPRETDARYDLGGPVPPPVGVRDTGDRCYAHHRKDDRWPPLVRVCVTVGCGVLAWATLLAPAWYMLSY
jgi:hypothetical protein